MMRKRALSTILAVFCLNLVLIAQKKNSKRAEFTGLVTDYSGEPIRRAIIFVDSAETLTKTNNKGIYKFKTKAEVKNIAVFDPNRGMLSKDVDGKTKVDFVFPKEMPTIAMSDLTELGYKLQGDKSDRYKRYDNIYELIATEFTGVTVRSGKIKVRGSAAISGPGAEPLYVVDGTYVKSISTINPVEVKSIEILKDQDATLYGVRGGNGVILIELRK